MYLSCCPGKPHEPGEPHCQLLSTTTLGECRVHFGGRAASAFAATAPSATETTSAASATTTAARRASARFVTSTDLLARARPRTPTWLRGNGVAESTLGPVRGGSPPGETGPACAVGAALYYTSKYVAATTTSLRRIVCHALTS